MYVRRISKRLYRIDILYVEIVIFDISMLVYRFNKSKCKIPCAI